MKSKVCHIKQSVIFSFPCSHRVIAGLIGLFLNGCILAGNTDSLTKVFNKAGHDTVKINALIELGGIYRTVNPDSSLVFLNQALSLARRNSQTEGSKILYKNLSAKILRLIGITYRNTGNFTKAIESYKESVSISRSTKNIKELSLCLNNLGVAHYYTGSLEMAEKYYNLSLKFCEQLKDTLGILSCYSNLGNIASDRGDYEKAITLYQRTISVAESMGDSSTKSICYNNIGIVYSHQGNFNAAVENYIASLKISEKLKDFRSMASCMSNIGSVHYYQKSFKKALEYQLKSIEICKEHNFVNQLSDSYSNIGNVYKDMTDFAKALEYYSLASEICEQTGDMSGLSTTLLNIGIIYHETGKYSMAIPYYNKSIKIDTELGDLNSLAIDNNDMASLYINLADSASLTESQRIGYLKKSVEFAVKAFKIAEEIGALPVKCDAASILYNANLKLNNKNEALKYAGIYLAAKDSLFNTEKNRALTEMEAIYKSEKKQLEIENLENEKKLQAETIARQDAESRRKTLIIYFFIGIVVIISVLSSIIYKLFIQKKKANIILGVQKHEIEEKNEELKQQNEEIIAQRDEIESQRNQIAIQRDTVIEQKEVIEKIYSELTDSIKYAKRIQTALLPPLDKLICNRFEYFVMFLPKNIVSGDFWWVAEVNDYVIFCVADCTGHGVPGAFMSMLGISFLNEIIRKKEVTKASDVLDQLRDAVVEAFKQKGFRGEQNIPDLHNVKFSASFDVKDGMDISLCAINVRTLKMKWAGANNPFYIIRPNAASPQQMDKNRLIEIKGDKMPIAIYLRMEHFTNHEIQLEHGDKLYLFSDGLPDQFGGPYGKKFLYKRFKELLLLTSSLSMKEQGDKINAEFNNWLSYNGCNYEQIDDVTILGIEI